MKLNKEIYSSDRTISLEYLKGIKTTKSMKELVDSGKLQLNNPIDESIFYAVDFNPPDDYFIRSGYNKPHQSEFVKGTNTPSGVCAMFGRLNVPSTPPLQNMPVIAIQTKTTYYRLAYDSKRSDYLGYYFGTEYRLKDFLFLIKVIAYRFEYSGAGDVSAFSDKIDVDVDTFEKQYKNTHHIVGIYALPYYLRSEVGGRQRCQGFNIIPFCTYSKNSIAENYDIYGALYLGDADQSHAILNTFIYGSDDLYTGYFSTYSYYYANLGYADLWKKHILLLVMNSILDIYPFLIIVSKTFINCIAEWEHTTHFLKI